MDLKGALAIDSNVETLCQLPPRAAATDANHPGVPASDIGPVTGHRAARPDLQGSGLAGRIAHIQPRSAMADTTTIPD